MHCKLNQNVTRYNGNAIYYIAYASDHNELHMNDNVQLSEYTCRG